MNLLFIEMDPAKLRGTEPFMVAYDLDFPGPVKRQWRVDARRGVEAYPRPDGNSMQGVWRYLERGTWLQVTRDEAYARFPALQEAIENWKEPW